MVICQKEKKQSTKHSLFSPYLRQCDVIKNSEPIRRKKIEDKAKKRPMKNAKLLLLLLLQKKNYSKLVEYTKGNFFLFFVM